MHDHDEITMKTVHNMNLAASAAAIHAIASAMACILSSSDAFSYTKP